MATRDLTPQDEGNGPYVPDENGAGVRGQTGDPALDAHTESHDSVLPPEGVRAEGESEAGSDSDKDESDK